MTSDASVCNFFLQLASQSEICIPNQGGFAAAGCRPPRFRACPQFLRCMTYIIRNRIIDRSRLYMRQHCQGVRSNKSCLNKEKETLESGAINHSTKLRHSAHGDKQQQQPAHNFLVRVIATKAGAAAAAVRQQQASISSIIKCT